LKRSLRIALVLTCACAFLTVFSNFAEAQKVDVAFGISTTLAPGASAANGIDHYPVSLSGGTYPGFSGDVEVFHHIGIGGEIYWRASQGEWGGYQPFRPFFYDVNAMYSPKLANHTYLDLSAGVGALSTRFYTENEQCNYFTCTNYSDVNHFAGHFGVGLKFYPAGHFFVRPEASLYLVNNNQEFSSNRVARVGVSIGYTFGAR
jgi:hypothetical protein